MHKLRKLLEDAQLESEDAIGSLRKKHQESLLDYQEQIEQLHKKNNKYSDSSKTHLISSIQPRFSLGSIASDNVSSMRQLSSPPPSIKCRRKRSVVIRSSLAIQEIGDFFFFSTMLRKRLRNMRPKLGSCSRRMMTSAST